jgi:hypothetical protein
LRWFCHRWTTSERATGLVGVCWSKFGGARLMSSPLVEDVDVFEREEVLHDFIVRHDMSGASSILHGEDDLSS